MAEIFGYCRISTRKQNIERQERTILAAYPDAHIVKGIFTGTKITGLKERIKLEKEIIPRNSRDFYGGNTDAEVMKMAGISKNTYYKFKASLKTELQGQDSLI